LYLQHRWLAPQAEPATQKAPETIALVAPAFDQQLNAMSLNIDAVRQSLDRIAAGQEQIARGIDQIAISVATGQEPTMRTTDKTATSTAQASSTDAGAITVESRAEVRPPPTKQLSAASGHDVSCFPSASAVVQNHPEGWPSWTMKARGHEGTLCWYAATRPRTSNHRREPTLSEKEKVETSVSAPPAPYARAPE
jgi:hypothetical protein